MDDIFRAHRIVAFLAQFPLHGLNIEYMGFGTGMAVITVTHIGLNMVPVPFLFANEYLYRFSVNARRSKGDLMPAIATHGFKGKALVLQGSEPHRLAVARYFDHLGLVETFRSPDDENLIHPDERFFRWRQDLKLGLGKGGGGSQNDGEYQGRKHFHSHSISFENIYFILLNKTP